MSRLIVTSFLALALATMALPALAENAPPAERNPLDLPTLITATPAEGFELALKLSRLGVSQVQHDKSVLKAGRPDYSKDAAQLIQASQTVAINFQTVAQANNFWRESSP